MAHLTRTITLLTLLTFGLLTVGLGAVHAETTLERVQREGYVRVGFANEAPYAYAETDGTLTGMNVEVARAVLKRLGIPEMDGVLTQFGALIPGLQAGRFDIITAGMYITPLRCEAVSFAEPEYTIGQGLGVAAGNPLNLRSYEDIAANPKARVAVMTGAIEYDYLIDSGVSPNQIHNVPDQPAALAALKAGRVDAITMTGPALQAILDAGGDETVERVQDMVQPIIDGSPVAGYGSAAFRDSDTDFIEAYNRELANLLETDEYAEILERFGFSVEFNHPGDMTAAELCRG